MNIAFIGSPNYWPGRSQPVRELVQHWMVGTLRSTDATFQNLATSTSAHYGIEDGRVHQYVKDSDTAWHSLQANSWTIGIEHSAGPGRPASDATYQTSIWLNAQLCKRYGLNPDVAIVSHNKYVNTQCPGTMDINRIKQGVKQLLGGDVIPDQDNYYWRFGVDLALRIRGRQLSRAEFRRHLVGQSSLKAIEILADDPEAQTVQHWQNIGRTAVKDKWDQQIFGLQDIVKNLSERMAQMTVQMEALRTDTSNKELADALQKRLDDTSKELEKTVKELKEVKAEREASIQTGNRVVEWLGNLFKRS